MNYKNLFLVFLILSIILLITFTVVTILLARKLSKIKKDVRALDLSRDPISKRVESMDSLLKIIDNMITTSIISKRKFEIFLNTPNKNLDYDNVIKEVSTEVLKGLRENVLIDNSLIFSQEFLMKYIIDKTTILYINYIKENIQPHL